MPESGCTLCHPEIAVVGEAPPSESGATAGAPQYLQDTGGIGAFAAITAGKRVIRVGYAKNATDLFVQIMDLGKKAA